MRMPLLRSRCRTLPLLNTSKDACLGSWNFCLFLHCSAHTWFFCFVKGQRVQYMIPNAQCSDNKHGGTERQVGIYRILRYPGAVILKYVSNAPSPKYEPMPGLLFLFLVRCPVLWFSGTVNRFVFRQGKASTVVQGAYFLLVLRRRVMSKGRLIFTGIKQMGVAAILSFQVERDLLPNKKPSLARLFHFLLGALSCSRQSARRACLTAEFNALTHSWSFCKLCFVALQLSRWARLVFFFVMSTQVVSAVSARV